MAKIVGPTIRGFLKILGNFLGNVQITLSSPQVSVDWVELIYKPKGILPNFFINIKRICVT